MALTCRDARTFGTHRAHPRREDAPRRHANHQRDTLFGVRRHERALLQPMSELFVFPIVFRIACSYAAKHRRAALGTQLLGRRQRRSELLGVRCAFGAQPLALNHRTQYILDIIYVPLMRIWRTKYS